MIRHVLRTAVLCAIATAAPFAHAEEHTLEAGPVDLAAAEKRYKRECRACHGPTAKGLASYPKLAAQPEAYLIDKLLAYRAGETLGPNTPLMAPRAKKLSDQDIANLAAFISGLPG